MNELNIEIRNEKDRSLILMKQPFNKTHYY